MSSKLSVRNKEFYLNDEPIRIISGAIHYFRVVPEYWEDRLVKLKACGCNTVETYVAWNIHEPEEEQFNFQGIRDIEKFIETAHRIGLYVIIRFSPYICAEWEFGGFPYWLLKDDNIHLRCYDSLYLEKVDRYYDTLIPRLVPYQSTKGGPIIAVQIENEYGSYGNDKKYLAYLKGGIEKRGIDVLLFTSDGPTDHMLTGGTLSDVYKTVNFGSKAIEAFAKCSEYETEGPMMCMEFWNGWFDHWNEEHHTRDVKDAGNVLEEILSQGASVNFYMFHGGTNFGFYNGANHSDNYEATVTSYDYDSPLDEAGDLTEKYFVFKNIIETFEGKKEEITVSNSKKYGYGKVNLNERVKLFDILDDISEAKEEVYPKSMEKMGQDYGFILYKTKISGFIGENTITIEDVNDRAMVFIDGEYVETLERAKHEKSLKINLLKGEHTLEILVENMGRVNYGSYLRDCKGINKGVRIGGQFLFWWVIYNLPLNNIEIIRSLFKQDDYKVDKNQPCFYRGEIEIEEVCDTFLDMKKWTKGVVFINGFNLGRYWNISPYRPLYVPAPILKIGKNEIIIFELHENEEKYIELKDSYKE